MEATIRLEYYACDGDLKKMKTASSSPEQSPAKDLHTTLTARCNSLNESPSKTPLKRRVTVTVPQQNSRRRTILAAAVFTDEGSGITQRTALGIASYAPATYRQD